jgi:hypothetical protein
VFGRRKRQEAAAAEAAREAERHALFAKLAERPEHICPFLGLEGDRTGYIDGISDEHRCFAFGDPAPLSAEQQTRVCQERGYGNCPRYLRGVLVIPTEELEALRRPRAPAASPTPPPPRVAPQEERSRLPLLALLALLLIVGAGAGGAYLLFVTGNGVAGDPSPTPSAEPSASPSVPATPSGEPSASTAGSPTPEPTPSAGDTFAFYEVAVGPGTYSIYPFSDGELADARSVRFDDFSFARARPVEVGDGSVVWVIEDGDLAGNAYRFPDSGEFSVRAVFLSDAGVRRSFFLDEAELDDLPEETPAPQP